MATIMVGSARHDEHGACYTGGTAGDQLQTSSTNDTVGEVSMQEMYTHSSGWYIMRAKSVAHAAAIAERMIAACNNAHIGYDQNQRTGINTYGIDTTKDTECDCSSLMRQVVKEATGTDPGNFTTANEVSCLDATGLFESKVEYVSQSKTPVYDGDILVTKVKGHTVAVVSGNPRSTSSTAVIGTAVAKMSMHVRDTSSTSGNSIGTVAKGGTVEVLEVLSNGWYKIVWSKALCGYAYTSNVSDKYYTYTAVQNSASSDDSTASSEVVAVEAAKSFDSGIAGTYKVTDCSALNVRTGAGTGKGILTTIPAGTSVKNYGYYTKVDSTKWLYIQFTFNGVKYTGFASGKYLSK